MTEDDFLAAARATYTKMYTGWRVERSKLDQTVGQAVASKTVIMSGNYWQAEWRAREKLRMAERVLEIFQP